MKKLFYCSIIVLVVFSAGNKVFAQNANTSLSNLAATTKINTNLLPDSISSHNLGSAGRQWNNLYMKGSLFLNKQKFISTAGAENTFLGIQAGKSITSGSYDVATGYSALYSNTTGY